MPPRGEFFFPSAAQYGPTEGLQYGAPQTPDQAPGMASNIWQEGTRDFLNFKREVDDALNKTVITHGMIAGPEAEPEVGFTPGVDMPGMDMTTATAPTHPFLGMQPETSVDTAQLQKEFPGVKGIDHPMPRRAAQIIADAQTRKEISDDIAARYPRDPFHTVAAMGLSTVTSLLDPYADAAFMIPVIGEAREAAIVARAGETAGLFGRVGARAAVGAARALPGGAVIGATNYELDPDKTLGEAAEDTLQFALGGALFHVGLPIAGRAGRLAYGATMGAADRVFGALDTGLGGRLGDAAAQFTSYLDRQFSRTPEGDIASLHANVHDAATRVAAAQVADGLPVEVRPVFDAAAGLPGLGGEPYRAQPRGPLEPAAAPTPGVRDATAVGRTAYMNEAVARTAGQPSQLDVRLEAEAQAAKATAPDKTLKEMEADYTQQIAALRTAGLLTSEDEAIIAMHEAATAPEGEAEAAAPAPLVTLAERVGAFERGDLKWDELTLEEKQAVRRGQIASALQRRKSLARLVGEGEVTGLGPEGARAPLHPDVEEMLRDPEGASAADVAREIARTTTLPAYRDLAEKLSGLLGEARIGVKESDEPAFEAAYTDLGRGPDREPGDILIRHFPSRPEQSGLNEQTILHEMLHSAVIQRYGTIAHYLDENLDLADLPGGHAAAEAIHNYQTSWQTLVENVTRNLAEDPAYYGNHVRAIGLHEFLRSPDEAMAWSMTNPRVQEWLRSITPEGERLPTGSPEETFWDKLVEWFQHLLNLPKTMTTALDHFLDAGHSILEAAREDQPDTDFSEAMLWRAQHAVPGAEEWDQSGLLRQRLPQAEAGRGGVGGRPGEPEIDEAAKLQMKVSALANIVKQRTAGQQIDSIVRSGGSLKDGFLALIRGIVSDAPGARDSTGRAQAVRQSEYIRRLTTNLDKTPGALDAWQKRRLTDQWHDELVELEKHEGGKPGVTGNPLALKIAEAVKDVRDLARMRGNQAGAWIGDYSGYEGRTQHDAAKISKMGYAAWRQLFVDNADLDRTFGDISGAERESMLHELYDRLASDVHLTADRAVSPREAALGGGPGNVARRMSAERTIHWKDAQSWRNYQRDAGNPDIEDGIRTNLLRAARDTELISRWGTTPKQMLANLFLDMERNYYQTDPAAVQAMRKARPDIEHDFSYITGEAHRPQNDLANKVISSAKAFEDATKLGNVLLAHSSIGMTKPFQLQYLGVGKWRAYTSVLTDLLRDKSPENRAILENLRAEATGLMQHLNGYEPIDGVPGALSALRSFQMRLGFLPQVLEKSKVGAQFSLSNMLGQDIDKPFAELPMQTRRGLTMSGIGEPEWDALRRAPNPEKDAHGSTYLTPAAGMRADVSELAGARLRDALDEEHAARIIDQTRDRLSMKLASYLQEASERAATTPGIAERAMIDRRFGKTAPLLGQYKLWAVSVIRQMWGQAIRGSASKAEMAKYIAQFAAVGTAIGYGRIAITAALSGQTPPTFNNDPVHDAALVAQSATAGGGLGIFGDYLFGHYTQYGQTTQERVGELATSVLGPVLGDVIDAAAIGAQAINAHFDPSESHDRKMKDAATSATRFATSHIPIVNTWYLNHIMHWLFIDRLNEMANPGYLQRHEAAVRKNGQQYFWLAPTQSVGAAP